MEGRVSFPHLATAEKSFPKNCSIGGKKNKAGCGLHRHLRDVRTSSCHDKCDSKEVKKVSYAYLYILNTHVIAKLLNNSHKRMSTLDI